MKFPLLVFAFLLFVSPTFVSAQMSAHYINVGQADSILLEFKNAAVLVDAGGEATGDTRDRDHLIKYLNDFFARRTDLKRTLLAVIISHPHLDHTKNLVPVLQNFRVKNFIDGGNQRGSGFPQLRSARKVAKANKIRYRAMFSSHSLENCVRSNGSSFSEVVVRFRKLFDSVNDYLRHIQQAFLLTLAG